MVVDALEFLAAPRRGNSECLDWMPQWQSGWSNGFHLEGGVCWVGLVSGVPLFHN